jgi:hypothetical protein
MDPWIAWIMESVKNRIGGLLVAPYINQFRHACLDMVRRGGEMKKGICVSENNKFSL